MNKIILKFKFLSETSVSLELIYVDDVVLAKDGNIFISFYNTDDNFLIYSSNNSNLAYTYNALKLPSFNEYKPCEKVEMKFSSNAVMKSWLKKLFRTLHKWDNLKEWRTQNNTFVNKKVIMQKDFWIL